MDGLILKFWRMLNNILMQMTKQGPSTHSNDSYAKYAAKRRPFPAQNKNFPLSPRLLAGFAFLLFAAACSPARAVGTAPPVLSPSPTAAPATASPSHTPTASPSPTGTPIPSTAPTKTPANTPTATIVPTYAVLRGEVLVRSNCRYGPGAMYLYKYGLVPGSNLEVFGRNELGTWILIRAIGGTNPCWVKASLMDVKGDVMSIEPTYIPLPQSPYYSALRKVHALRNGNDVRVSWAHFSLRAGDEMASPRYLVEAWTCEGGELVFTPLGTNENSVWITDEPGCSEPSHGRVYGVEKHGYTNWVKIPWPAFE